MGFSGALQWWDEWHLRVLVLASLFIQYFLFFSAEVRRRALPAWFRLFMLLSYLGGDAVAIYALATLFNSHGNLPVDGGGLEVLWAPVLLVHLGGQHPMTAYSLQDNELWTRNAITVASQVTVTLYVFCKSWSGEKRLLLAAILMFVVGIIRSCQKPWALKSASISAILASFSPSTLRKQGLVARFWQACTSGYGYELKSSGILEAVAEEKDISLQEFARDARKLVLESELAPDQDEAEKLSAHSVDKYVYRLLVDIPVPYSTRIKFLRDFMSLDFLHAHHLLDVMLLSSFGLLYTRTTIINSGLGLCFCFLLPFLAIASFIIFSTGHKYYHSYNTNDVKVTYILFSCTALLEVLFLLAGLCMKFTESVKVSQHSLMSCGFRAKTPTILMKLATLVSCEDYVNIHFYIYQEPLACSAHVVKLVHGYVRDGWKEYIHNAASFRRFISRKGHWTLRKRRHHHLRWSLNMAFDRSILLWHIATDTLFDGTEASHIQECVNGSALISRYMAYLLCIQPEMLMPGTRSSIFTVSCHDFELVLGLKSPLRGDLVPMGLKLRQELLELHDERERWEVIQGVWVEMLCYSASRCRGYLHAKNLSEGVELLSRVWLLLSIMGMDTFADSFHKPRPLITMKEEEADVGGADIAINNEINISVA